MESHKVTEQNSGPKGQVIVKNVGFAKRVSALLIDICFINAIWYFWGMWEQTYVSENSTHYELSSLGLVIFFAYYLVLEMTPIQATLGKYMLNLKVTNRRGRRINFGDNIMRNIGRFCTVCTIFSAYLLVLIREDKKSLNELISDTYVCSSKV